CRAVRAPARPWRDPGTWRRRRRPRVLRTDHAGPGNPGRCQRQLPVRPYMLSKKARNIALFGAIAALLVAVGYWNISPESFLDRPVAQVDQSAIDYYAINAHSVQFLPDG